MKYKGIIHIPRSLPPVLGIPVPGERPFVVDASRFAAVMRITNVISWTIETVRSEAYSNGNRKTTNRVLHVLHKTGKVRGRLKFFETPMNHDTRQRIAKWREAQFKKRNRPSCKPKPGEKLLARLEQELRKLRDRAPYNPLLPPKAYRSENTLPDKKNNLCPNHGTVMTLTGNALHYVQSCAEPGCAFGHYEYLHPELRWKQEKPLRKRLAKVTAFFLQNPTKKPQAYDRLTAIAEPKFKYAQRRTQYENWTPFDYWQHLPEVCGHDDQYHSCRRYERKPVNLPEELQRHAEARVEHAVTMREAAALRSQIEAVKQM